MSEHPHAGAGGTGGPAGEGDTQPNDPAEDDGTRRARDLLGGYLAGEQDPDQRPALFEDDLLLVAVARMCRSDPGWLDAQLDDVRRLADRRAVLRDLRDAVRPVGDGQPST